MAKRPHAPTRAEIEARAQATRADLEAGVREAREQFDATNEKIQARTGRNLIAAIAIGLGLGALLLVSLLIWKPLFIAFAALLVGFTTFGPGAARCGPRNAERSPARTS